MQVVLTKTWMGNPEGLRLDLRKDVAERLINWGTAKAYKPAGRPPKQKENANA